MSPLLMNSRVSRCRSSGDDGPVGRRLDFLMQELNREANTLSSKSIVTETTRCAVDLKVLIEQMREQIQNIEYEAVDFSTYGSSAAGRELRIDAEVRK